MLKTGPTNRSVQAVVVGAGLSGLVCALCLEQYGIEVLVLEKEEQIGGQLATDFVDGYTLDHGFQVLQTGYPAAMRWLDYDSLDLRTFPAGSQVFRQGVWHEFADPIRYPNKLFQTLLSPIGTLGDKVRVGWLRAELFLRSALGLSGIQVAPNLSTVEFLRDRGFSEAIIDDFFRPFFSGVFLEPELLTRAEKFLQLFGYFSSSLAAVPAGGMNSIPRQLAGQLKIAPQTSTTVQKVEGHTIHTSAGPISTQHVVLAGHAPESLLASPAVDFHSCRTLYYSAPRQDSLGTALRLIAEPGPICNIAPLGEVAPYSPKDRTLIAVTTLCGHSTVDEVTKQLHRLLPNDWTYLRSYHIPQALPQEARSLRGDLRISDHVVSCGAHRYSGSIQGAMASGELAAMTLLGQI